MGQDGKCYAPVACPTGSTLGDDQKCHTNPGDSGTSGQCPPAFVQVGILCVTPSSGGSGGGGSGNNGGSSGGGGGGGGTTPPDGTCTAGSVCSDSASGGYDCSAAPTCSGDTVLCNIDYQSWAGHCPQGLKQLDEAEGFLGSLPSNGNSAVEDADPAAQAGQIDSTGFLGGGTCPSFDPLNISLHGVSAALNFNNSGWCSMMQLLHALLLAFAYFEAAKIIARGG